MILLAAALTATTIYFMAPKPQPARVRVQVRR